MSSHEFECPSCGGIMEFDTASQMLKCLYCDTMLSIEEYEKIRKDNQAESSEDNISTSENANDVNWEDKDSQYSDFGGNRAVYSCNSCGGEIIVEQNQGAATCPFCGNNVTFKEVFMRGRKPDYIIPFKLDKNQAKIKYKSFVKSKKLLPKNFIEENHIDEIKGVYVPYWIFNGTSHVVLNAHASKMHVRQRGKDIINENYIYQVFRDGSVDFEAVPVDGSSKIQNDITESIEPFDTNMMVEYNDAYLAGFIANQYDVDDNETRQRAMDRMANAAIYDLKQSIEGYDSVIIESDNHDTNITKTCYALYPVWLLSTTYEGESFTFAMNGQSGKFVGNLPIDKKKTILMYLAFGILFSIVFYIFGIIFGI